MWGEERIFSHVLKNHVLSPDIGASVKRTSTVSSLSMQLGLRSHDPLDYQVDSVGGWVMPVVQVPGSGRRRSWSRLCGSLWFVCAGVERASREGSSYIYTSSTLTSRWHQRGQALWRTTGPPINLATFLFSILDSKRRLGTFKVFLVWFCWFFSLSWWLCFLTGRLFVY